MRAHWPLLLALAGVALAQKNDTAQALNSPKNAKPQAQPTQDPYDPYPSGYEPPSCPSCKKETVTATVTVSANAVTNVVTKPITVTTTCTDTTTLWHNATITKVCSGFSQAEKPILIAQTEVQTVTEVKGSTLTNKATETKVCFRNLSNVIPILTTLD